MKNKDRAEVPGALKDFLLMTAGTLLVTLGVYFFKFPNNFSTGGVSGISVILGHLIPAMTPGTLVLIINSVLLLAGLLIIGRDFTYKTVYCSLLMSGGTWLLERLVPLASPLTDQPLLELIFAIFLPAAGSAILFNIGASTGGTDIVAMVIKHYTHLNISKALFASDILIVMATFFVFGTETWLFCLLGFLAKVFAVNNILESFRMSKYCTVITAKKHEEKLCRFITEELHKTATVSEAYTGAYRHDEKAVLLVALTRRQAILLKQFTKELGKDTFVIICNAGDIIGKGFREQI